MRKHLQIGCSIWLYLNREIFISIYFLLINIFLLAMLYFYFGVVG